MISKQIFYFAVFIFATFLIFILVGQKNYGLDASTQSEESQAELDNLKIELARKGKELEEFKLAQKANELKTESFEYEDDLKRESQYEDWLSKYKSPNPKNQEYCINILKNKKGSSSQMSQDLFLFFNFFKYWPMLNITGFYLDSGANEAIHLSNTYFYDVCLGWNGICVEPEVQYHTQLREKRSCILVTECISDVEKNVTFNNANELGSVVENNPNVNQTNCLPLFEILNKHPVSAVSKEIDFWSLDVEGYELVVLETVNFNLIKVNSLLIEEFWLSTRRLDRKLSESNFNKFHQLPIDSVYTPRNFKHVGSSVNYIWYPEDYKDTWKLNDDYRKRPEVISKLQC